MAESTTAGTFPTSGINGENLFAYYNAGKPTYVEALAKRFGLNPNPFNIWFMKMALDKPIPGNGEYYAWEKNRRDRTIKVYQTVSSTGVNTTVTLQLDPTFISSNYGFFGRESEIVRIPGTGVMARIQSIAGQGTSSVYFTLKPVKATNDIGTLTAGTELPIVTQAVANGMGMPGGVVVGATRRDYNLQVFTEQFISEGNEVTKSQWYQAFDDAGQPIGYTTDMINDTQGRLDKKIIGAYLFGERNTAGNITETTRYNNVNDVNTMEGLDPAIARLGKTVIMPTGTFDVTACDDWAIYALQQGTSTNKFLMPVGVKLRNDIENSFPTQIKYGTDLTADVTNQFKGEGANPLDRFYSLGFGGLYKSGNVYLLQTVPELTDPTGLGAPGQNLDEGGWVIPLAQTKDAKSGGTLDSICTRYVAGGGHSRKLQIWTLAGSGGDAKTYVHEYDDFSVNFRAHLSIQFLMLNQFIRIKSS